MSQSPDDFAHQDSPHNSHLSPKMIALSDDVLVNDSPFAMFVDAYDPSSFTATKEYASCVFADTFLPCIPIRIP